MLDVVLPTFVVLFADGLVVLELLWLFVAGVVVGGTTGVTAGLAALPKEPLFTKRLMESV